MIKIPQRTKYRKQHRRYAHNLRTAGCFPCFGTYVLKATSNGIITGRQIESARVAINRQIKKFGKLYIRVFPDKPFTKKPVEQKLGKGKGNVEFWGQPITKGKIIFEVKTDSSEFHHLISTSLAKGGNKLPFKCCVHTLQ